MRTGGQPQPLKCGRKHTRRIRAQRAVLGKLRRRNGGVAHVGALSGILPLARGEHAGTNVGGVFLTGLTSCGKRGVFNRLHSNLQVDSVEQRTGQTVQILLNGSLGAGAAFRAVPAAFAGIHRGNELKPCRIRHLTGDTRDGNSAVLKRLAQGFEHIAAEFRKFIQKQHTAVRERDLAGDGQPPCGTRTACHCVGRGIMVRCTERPFGTFDRLLSSADGGPDTDNLQPFAVRQRRQNGGKALCSHALARTGRSGKKHVVSACSRDLERAFDRVLTEHMRKIQRIVLRFGSGRRSTRRERLSAVQMSEQLI